MFKQEIIEISTDSHPNHIYDYSLLKEDFNYRKNDRVDIICPKHGNLVFHPILKLFLKGSNCPLCANEIRIKKNREKHTKEEFIEKAIKLNNNKLDYDYSLVNYINARTDVDIKCNKCGNIFHQTPNDHLSGKGCPFCKFSKLENKVKSLLNENKIGFISQKRFDWSGLYSFDFYLPQFDLAIECQGKQHYSTDTMFDYNKSIERDLNKNRLCLENNLSVVYVFDDKVNIENDILANNDLEIYNVDNSINCSRIIDKIKLN